MPPTLLSLQQMALNLSFKDLFQDLYDKEGETKPNTFGLLSEDLGFHIISYLNPYDCCRVGKTCRVLYNMVLKSELYSDSLWQVHLTNECKYGLIPETVLARSMRSNSFYIEFVKANLYYYESELRHYGETQRLLNALSLLPGRNVVGLVGNIGKFESPEIALAVSFKRKQAMQSVAVRNYQTVALQFRKNTSYTGPVSFVPILDQENYEEAAQSTPYYSLPEITSEGFLGYAVNLIQLRPLEEHYRHSLLLSAYGNLSVWRSAAEARQARQRGEINPNFPVTSLDYYTQPSAAVGESAVEHWCRTGRTQAGEYLASHVSFNGFRPLFQTGRNPLEYTRKLQARRDAFRHSLATLEYSK